MIGEIIQFAGSVIPDGYLECDGSAVSRDTYSDLFDVIGITYGSGDGATTFNLPDLTGKVAMGASSTYTLGTNGGEATHELTSGELASHIHVVPSHGHANTIAAQTPSLSHTITQAVFKYTQLSGGGNRWGGSGSSPWNGTAAKSMSRSTNLAVTAHAATACTMSGGVTDCDALTTDSVGADGSHNNMMPFLSLTYLIRCEPDVPPAPKMYFFNGCLPVGPNGGYICGKGRK
jgi:microcystin-dependent protein